jgi:linoleoyl-CoA desaturase
MSSILSTRFDNTLAKEFSKTLNARVSAYFKDRKEGRYANAEMIVKTIFMLSLYFGPYSLVLSGVITSGWFYFVSQVVMGFGLAGIGLSVMHDANHGAYSRHKWVNQVIGYSMNLVGGNATNWKIQHNVKHHTYTNIDGHDEDVSLKGGILRLSPNSAKKWIHKYQHIYAWFLYGLMTISWIGVKDITQLVGYTKDGMLRKQQPVGKAWTWIIITKLSYYSYILVIPMVFSPFSWWMILLGFLVMHYVAGFILAVIFQPAHVMEVNEFPTPDEHQMINENWSVHQLKTTCDFAPNSKIFSWYVGGLNFQIEHHLFPNICHVHYRKIAKIVRETAEEFNMPYKSYRTFWAALVSHGRMLYVLGR